LTGGRTGARVVAIRPGYVLKALPRNNWRLAAMQAPDAGEGPLWLSGATRELPAPVACPTLDVAVHVANDEWWMLMRDVSDGIRARGAFKEPDERALLAAIARLHARARRLRRWDLWAYHRKVRIDFSHPGKPTDNCCVETFNGSLRDECLNAHWFESLGQAREIIEAWRHDYNESRPHMALADVAPREYARQASLLACPQGVGGAED